MKLNEGMIVTGPFFSEPVRIEKIINIGTRIRLIGVSLQSNNHIDRILDEEQVSSLETEEYILDFTLPGSEAFLALEGERFKYASYFDPLLAVNVSKIDPLPFQVEAVYGYILKLPRIRFLIADDPGAGKTIMAGLIIKEMKLRGLIKKILIVVPSQLKAQWMREMKEKFQENFVIIDRNILDLTYGDNPWQKENQIITSMDFAKQDDVLPSISSVNWDLIIVDEAHKMSAYKYGDKIDKTDRYKLGEKLSAITEHLLFLTATPHKGDPENFRLFQDLLIPGFFASNDLVNESIQNKDNPLFIRRLKEDLRDFDGKPIFTNRYPKTIKFKLSDKEKGLYNDLSNYVLLQYNRALNKNDKKKNIAFALLILQRRMASSTYALLNSLERRKKRLEELLTNQVNLSKTVDTLNIDEIEELEESKRWEEENKWETISTAENKEELRSEILTLEKLISQAKDIIDTEEEVKLKELKKAIEEGFKKIKEVGGNEKILIFTESKDTLDYLVTKIHSWGYSVNSIHGGMNIEDRVNAEKVFKNETQIMVATEAAGEGINLQFCNLMINYDIPWNPNRLEQRMGRIHRYGQQKDVFIFNLVAEDTREGKVLAKLFDKLDEIRNALGSDRVFDVIGDTFIGVNLYQLIVDAVANARSIDDILKDIDIKVDKEYIEKIKEQLGESLATRNIDYSRVKEMTVRAKEYRLMPEYTQEFFIKAFSKAGGRLEIRDNYITIESIPYEIKKIAEDENFKATYGSILKRYPKITFDKEIAFKHPEVEFVSFGHPLFEALLKWVNEQYFSKLRKGAVFLDPDGIYNGIIWFFEGSVFDGKNEIAGKKIISIYDDGRDLREVNPSVLWDLVPVDDVNSIDLNVSASESESMKERVQERAIYSLENYKREILAERKRQAEIKRKYGIKSLEYLISELDAQLTELYERQEKGENTDLAIRNKNEKKKQYEDALKNLKKSIEQEINLSISTPEFISAIVVKPQKNDMLKRDDDIEAIGMKLAMEFEISEGRYPEDVSRENLGYDIRSEGNNEIRYIEVKARNEEGKIILTQNEFLKAKRFKNQYWLYIVTNASTNPELYIINNPSENLQLVQKVETVRFEIPLEEWKNKGVKNG
jgi:SNF2 family DNA or RNA helicase